jgi:hypothetical protein
LQELRKSLRLGAHPWNPIAAVAALQMRALPGRNSLVGTRRANRPSPFPLVAGPPAAALVVIRPGSRSQYAQPVLGRGDHVDTTPVLAVEMLGEETTVEVRACEASSRAGNGPAGLAAQ